MAQFLQITTTFIILLSLAISSSDGRGIKVRNRPPKDDSSLLLSLLETYNLVVRPIEKPSDVILVSFGISLVKIVEVDAIFGCLTTNVWQTMEWMDGRLRWDPAEYSNITSVKIPTYRIWTPDIVLYNNGRAFYSPMFSTHAIVRSNGTVTHVAPYSLVSYCDLNPEVAEQTCGLHFGSWAYGASELNLVMSDEEGGDVSMYIPNKNWELLGIPGESTDKINSWLPEPYVDITYNLVIRKTCNSSMGG